MYEAEWRGRRVAVKKLPPFSADAPITQAMFDALLREIELASKFNSDRWGRRWALGWALGLRCDCHRALWKGALLKRNRICEPDACSLPPSHLWPLANSHHSPTARPAPAPRPLPAPSPHTPHPLPRPRLVKVYGACTRDTEHVALIMELMQGGNLFQRIYDRNKRRMGYLEILQVCARWWGRGPGGDACWLLVAGGWWLVAGGWW